MSQTEHRCPYCGEPDADEAAHVEHVQMYHTAQLLKESINWRYP